MLPSWIDRRLVLLAPSVPLIVALGNEIGWWALSVVASGIIDTLAAIFFSVILGRRLVEAQAELSAQVGVETKAWEQAELREWDTAQRRARAAADAAATEVDG